MGMQCSAISSNMLPCCVCCVSNLSFFGIQHDLFLFPPPAWKQLKNAIKHKSKSLTSYPAVFDIYHAFLLVSKLRSCGWRVNGYVLLTTKFALALALGLSLQFVNCCYVMLQLHMFAWFVVQVIQSNLSHLQALYF
ncbi:hypothetical protein DUNSADRAFT_2863 [Dunaliella salina]|uniref:Encoded protein n=1 Tax=Dunaliella salina TaxID=3046 RepID=A0ABQ7FVX7_DUNSA|nr:hypothetical protein DUNSADRAFT_2863 [Dunaliella salina]|eukprot:KAF5826516.1 hypothetical protein DUNSADRAFT_2863 [Dunaliella salina]